MSNRLSKVARLGVIACATIVGTGCQDSTAPLPIPHVSGPTSATSATKSASFRTEPIKDQYIVVFRSGVNDVEGRTRGMLNRTRGKLKHTYKSGLRGFAASMTAEEASLLSQDASVAYVEQDQVVWVQQKGKETTSSSGKTTDGKSGGGKGGKGGKTTSTLTTTKQSMAPWGLDRIDQAALPLDLSYSYSRTGTGVNAYIVDSGIRTTHVEFGGRATADFSAINDEYGATGCFWHGTHVAGIIGGNTSGVAKGVSLHSVRVLNCSGAGTVSDLLAGIEWVTANRVLPAVMNISIVAGPSTAIDDAITRATESGISVFVAAGNFSDDACNYSPSRASDAIAVGASTILDELASFSNVGSCVDIVAPGLGIRSASDSTDTAMMGASGTSMASPHVAGAAALYLQSFPLSTPAEVRAQVLTASQADALTGIPLGTSNALLQIF